jgi:parallel beta-helix repeat protein
MAPDSDPALLAEAALTDCTFSRNASSGAQVDGLGTKGIFTECTLEQNGGRGLLFSRRSAGSATRCISRENKKSGIVAWQTLKDGIHISACQVIGNEGTGIEVLNAEGVTLAGNNCSENAEEGIRIQYGSTAKVLDNVCEINKGSGIVLLYCNTESLITGNRVGKNALTGIWIALGGPCRNPE